MCAYKSRETLTTLKPTIILCACAYKKEWKSLRKYYSSFCGMYGHLVIFGKPLRIPQGHMRMPQLTKIKNAIIAHDYVPEFHLPATRLICLLSDVLVLGM